MTDLPILFSAPMVRAILREINQPGTGKTVTRRIIKPVKSSLFTTTYPHYINGDLAGSTSNPTFDDLTSENGGNPLCAGVTRYCPGDRLWVRESLEQENGEAVGYPADRTWLPNTPWEWQRSKIPSIHMPRRLSRITLNVVGVKVERLQAISEADAIAEGIDEVTAEVAACDKSLRFWKRYRDGSGLGYVDCPIASYASLWTEINGAGSWEANPWVVAVTFFPILANIDAIRWPEGHMPTTADEYDTYARPR